MHRLHIRLGAWGARKLGDDLGPSRTRALFTYTECALDASAAVAFIQDDCVLGKGG